MSETRPRVLHVVEALGGGVASVLEDYITATPELEHYVLGARREGAHTGDGLAELAAEIIELPAGHGARVRAVSEAVERIQPALVHAHSSFAGVYARVARATSPARTAYTPHCYAFERRDVPPPVRWGFYLLERGLALRGGHVIACAPREAELAAGLSRRQRISYVPNIATVPDHLRPHAPRTPGEVLDVVTVGRVSPQKGPEFFTELAELARDLPDLRLTWIGAGAPEAEEALRAAGVEVTGWRTRGEVLERLAQADVYLHTAAWEGAPVTILEAAELGLPIRARAIEPLLALGVAPLADTPAELLSQIRALRDPERYAAALTASTSLASRHTPDSLRRALRDAYAEILPAEAAAQVRG